MGMEYLTKLRNFLFKKVRDIPDPWLWRADPDGTGRGGLALSLTCSGQPWWPGLASSTTTQTDNWAWVVPP